MSRALRDRARLVVLSAAACACGATATASAQAPPTGGADIPVLIAPSTVEAGYGEPGTRTVLVEPTAIVGVVVHVRGRLPGAARRRAILQRLDPSRGWRDVKRTRVHSTERFIVGWRPLRSGRTSLRVIVEQRAGAAAAPPIATVNVYRPAQATFFGPGLYGRQTFCGQVLTAQLLGVAHKSLPCGRLVAILHQRREIVVPVIDRGPFNPGFDWDLTQATADALGFVGSGTIGYVRAPTPAG